MSKVKKICVVNKDGSVFTIAADKDIQAILTALLQIKPAYTKTANITTLRNKYFGMMDELQKHTGTGYSKLELHESLKPILLGKFSDQNHLFDNGVPEYSTKNLNVEGWSALIAELESTARDIFSYTFNKD